MDLEFSYVMGVPPAIIHFRMGFSWIFHEVNRPAIGIAPWLRAPPIWDLGQVHPNAPALGQMEEPGAQQPCHEIPWGRSAKMRRDGLVTLWLTKNYGNQSCDPFGPRWQQKLHLSWMTRAPCFEVTTDFASHMHND